MKHMLIAAAVAVVLSGCERNESTSPDAESLNKSTATQTPAAPASEETASVAVTPATSEQTVNDVSDTPLKEARAAFQEVVSQYEGKQAPIEIDPESKEPVYLPIELAEPSVQKLNEPDAPFVGYVSFKAVSPGGKLPEGTYVFMATYKYRNGKWEYESISQQLQGANTEKSYDAPVFKPELLK